MKNLRNYPVLSTRHTGQALLIAVFLMLIVALLGATFVTVVALNQHNTARSSDHQQAARQAEAGEKFARLRLMEQGLSWRPKRSESVPQPSDISFDFYYDGYDRAYGWTTTGINDSPSTQDAFEKDGFVKFPDPRSSPTRDGYFMVRVGRVQRGESDNPNGAKTGDVRVEIIGRAADDPAVFVRRVHYQMGEARHPLTANMRTISNWDFAKNAVPSGEVAVTISNATTLRVTNLRAPFPADGNFSITVGGPSSGRVQSALVESVTNGDTLKLTTRLSALAGERVEIAATLGAPAALDFDFDGVAEANREALDFSISKTVAGGVRANGGLLFGGRALATLRSAHNADSARAAATVRASGLMRVLSPASGYASHLKINAEYSGGATGEVQLAASSADATFPGAWGTLSTQQKAEVCDDGWNRLRGEVTGERRVAEFAPPNLAGEQGNAYRRLSKFSPPRAAGHSNASQFGYGEGIYINNPTDVEKIGVAPDVYRAMTQSELRALWFDDRRSTTRGYGKNDSPKQDDADGKSLEEQHLRGWIGPDEFRGRGALIEVDADNARLIITLDTRDDRSSAAPTANIEPSPRKAWRKPDGTLEGDALYGGVYRKELAWPANGLVFAEGNIRIRGTASTQNLDPGRSLTVVSMNNIYIEGSLDAGARKILLLARRNVIMNPTGAVLSRPEAMTRLSAPTIANSTARTLRVHDAAQFSVGDFIEVKTTSNAARYRIAAIPDAATLLTERDLTATIYAAGTMVRILPDPLDVNSIPFTRWCTRLQIFSQAVQRRMKLASGTSQARLAFRHSAERKNAMTIRAINGATSTTRATLYNKPLLSTQDSSLPTSQKFLGVAHDAGNDIFPQPMPTDSMQATANSFRLNEFVMQINARRMPPNWYYLATVENGFNSGAKQPLYYFLASVGNRLDGTGSVLPDGKNILAASYSIPMATSVVPFLDGNRIGFGDERWNNSLGSFGKAGQFGFAALFGDATNPSNVWEDALTIDQSFYVGASGDDSGAYTLDSRTFPASSTQHTLALRLNNDTITGVKTPEDFFMAGSVGSTVTNDIPYYRLSRMKLENAIFDASTHELDALAPYATKPDGATMSVRAYVYAQEGSWMILGGDYFDDTVRASTDLDRDGVISRREEVAAHRYRRYNYRLDFHGAICENRSAVLESSGNVRGLVADWTDKWANVSFSGAAAGFNASTLSSAAGNFSSVNYSFDPDAALGKLNGDLGFRLPLSTDGWTNG